MIGTNDILQKYQTDTLTGRLTQIIDTIYVYNPKTTVLVASIAPLGGWTRVAQEKLAQPYNAAIPGIVAKEQALGHPIAFVDVHQALSHKGDLGGDQVHPSPIRLRLHGPSLVQGPHWRGRARHRPRQTPSSFRPPLPPPSK